MFPIGPESYPSYPRNRFGSMAQSVDFPRGPTKRSRWTSLWKKTAAAAKVAETSQPEPTRQRDGNRPVSLWSLIWELQGCIRMYQDVWDWFPSCCDLKSHDFLLPTIAANYTSEGILMNSSRSCSLPISLSITIHHCPSLSQRVQFPFLMFNAVPAVPVVLCHFCHFCHF